MNLKSAPASLDKSVNPSFDKSFDRSNLKSARPFPNRQKGVGFAGWLVIILVVGGAISVGTKLFPIYMDNGTVEGLLDKMSEEPDMALKSKSEIYSILESRLKVNNIRNFRVQDNLDVVRTKSGTSLVLDYEERVPVAGNIDLIASFRKEVELRE